MNYDKLSNNLNLLMAETRLNANELARRTGVPPSSIKKIRNNDNPNPTLTTLGPLANFFSITVSQLIGDAPLKLEMNQAQSTMLNLASQIPIISWDQAASLPIILNKEHPFVFAERQYSKNTFGLVIDENINEQFTKGTLILVDYNATFKGHDYALVLKENQKKPSIKQILIEDDQIYFKSLIVDNVIIQKSSDYTILCVVMEYRNYLR